MALCPGGWLIVGTAAAEGEGVQPAVLKLVSLLFSGGLLLAKQAGEMLEEAGYEDVQVLPASPGMPNRPIEGRPRLSDSSPFRNIRPGKPFPLWRSKKA